MKCRMRVSVIIPFALMSLLSKPIFAQEQVSTKETYSSKTTHNDGKTSIRYNTSSGFNDFNIEMRGKIELTDDDKDIKSISDDGYLEINKTTFGSRRTIVIEALGAGKVKKEY